jgi:branched-chain amino acid transport system ATP-binding protein
MRAVEAFYGESHVLHGVSFALGEGRLLGLLGRNGAGKSTCLNVVVGLLPPRSGEVAVFGRPVMHLPPEAIAALGVALVPQGRRIFPSLTTSENLIVAGRVPRGRKALWTIETVFGLFPRLSERRSQMARLLSGGEQQMLAIGRALMANPRILLMDEPSEGLAPQLVSEVARAIAKLKSEGQSILLVEQNVNLTLSLADDVVIINTGRIVFEGSAAETRAAGDALAQHLGVF